MARPKKPIDYALVEKLAQIHCTQAEIAEIVGVTTKTLQRDTEFCRIYKKGLHAGKMSLRRKQWQAAENGNTTMLIWLGKQYLEQKEDAELNQLKKDEQQLRREEFEMEKEKLLLEIEKAKLDLDIRSGSTDEDAHEKIAAYNAALGQVAENVFADELEVQDHGAGE